MNLNDLLAVWRSQDAAPLHGVNETLLRLALRQDEAKLQGQRRLEKRITYALSAGLIAVMAFFLAVMIYPYDDDVLTSWDYAIPIVGAAAALLWPGLLQMIYRPQAQREQSFGESLREQLNRHVAQLDYQAQRVDSVKFHLANNLPVIVCSMAIIFASLRINEMPLKAAWTNPWIWGVFVGSLVFAAIFVAVSVRMGRRSLERELLPHKRRLEALLKEIDEQ